MNSSRHAHSAPASASTTVPASAPRILMLALALLLTSCASCQLAPLGYHRISRHDLNPHATSHLTFPAHVDEFDRGIAWEKDTDERHVRVVYQRRGDWEPPQTLTVLNSSLALDLAFDTKRHYFMEAHPGVTQSSSAAREAQHHLPGWRIVVFDYHDYIPKYPPGQRYQPRRVLIAARDFHDQTVFIETSPMYDYWLADLLPAVSHFARQLFPHPSSGTSVMGYGYSGK